MKTFRNIGQSSFLAFLAWLLLTGCASNEKPMSLQPTATMRTQSQRDPNKIRYHLREFGIYEVGGKIAVHKHVQQPDRVLNTVTNSIRFLEITDKIPAVLGTHFGFTFDFEGPRFYTSTNLMFYIAHPPMKLPDGQTSSSFSWRRPLRLDAEGKWKSFVGFTFEKPFEVVAGKWVIRIYLDNEICLSKGFDVVPVKP
jgi:hypothetical protein